MKQDEINGLALQGIVGPEVFGFYQGQYLWFAGDNLFKVA